MARLLLGEVMGLAALLIAQICITLSAVCAGSSAPVCPAGFVNFGDSLTDTGNAIMLTPFANDADNAPYGQTFFGKPAGRFSDGRLVPDYFCLAFHYPLLDGYFKSTSFDYRHGINLAEAGSTAAHRQTALNRFSVYPDQVNQFKKFLWSVGETAGDQDCSNFLPSLPSESSFVGNWLYMIETGGGDLLNALVNNATEDDITKFVIPNAIGAIVNTIQDLHVLGAKSFLIFGVPAQGCSTIILTLISAFPIDEMGCVTAVNDMAQAINMALIQAIQGLRGKFTDSSIAFFDYFSANLEILKNTAHYGFDPATITTACCGAPGLGSKNYNTAITCGRSGSNVCDNPHEHIIWDGVHFTDAFYLVIAKFALGGYFTDQGINYTSLCNVDFSAFDHFFTYAQAYPTVCDSIFM